jgi:GNAT superfamily N-acetyltransferase
MPESPLQARPGLNGCTTGIEIGPEPFDSPDALTLRKELARELARRYGGDLEPGAKPSEEDIAVFLIARDDDGSPIGCGGLRSLGEPVVEIKRMYVRPEARRRGLGGAILEALEREALRLGFKVVRLETGPLQPDAIGLYARAGYREIPCFGAYSGGGRSRCFERRLGQRAVP